MPRNAFTRVLAAMAAFALVFGLCSAGFAYAAQDGAALQGGSINLTPADDPGAGDPGDPADPGDPGDPADPSDPADPDDPVSTLAVEVDYALANKGTPTLLTATVTGLGEDEQVASFTWEQSPDGETWVPLTGAEQSILVPTDDTTVGKTFRVTVTTDKGNTATSDPVALECIDPLLNVEVERALDNWATTLTVKDPVLAEGESVTSYRWEKSTDKGTTWEDVEGASAKTLLIALDENSSQLQYRATITTSGHYIATSNAIAPADPAGNLAATLSQVLDGTTVIVSANVGGVDKGETCAYRWQQSADNGTTWTNVEGESSEVLRVAKSSPPKGLKYRVIVLTTGFRMTVSEPIDIDKAEKQEQTVVVREKAEGPAVTAVETPANKDLELIVEVVGDPNAFAQAKSADSTIATATLGTKNAESQSPDAGDGPVKPAKATYALTIKPVARKGETTVTITVPETDAFAGVQLTIKVTVLPTGIDRLVADDEGKAENNTMVLQEEYDTLTEKGGGTITIPEGRYYFAAASVYGKSETCIRVRSNVKLVGAGQDKTIFLPVGMYTEGSKYEHGVDMFSWQGIYVEGGAYLVNADFENFTIDSSNTKGSPTGYNAAGKGFYFQLFKDCDWRYVTVRNTDGTGFGIDYPVNCVIADCHAEGCGKNAGQNDVGASGFGIGTGYAEDESIIIRNCTAIHNTKYGFFFEHQSLFDPDDVNAPGGQLFIVENCTASGNLYNFGGERAHDVTFVNCTSGTDEDEEKEAYTLFPFRLGDHSVRTSFTNCSISQALSTRDGNEQMQEAATWAYSQNVIDGPAGWVVSLDAMIPRSEAAEIVWRTYGRPDPVQINGNALRLFPYRDVQPGDGNADVASWCTAYQALVPGDFPGYFFPSRACSLAEFVYMAWRGAGAPETAKVQIGEGYEWAEYPFGWALTNGVVQFDEILNAGQAITRGQALIIAQRLSGKALCDYKASLYKTYSFEADVPAGGFSDVPDDHWVVEEGWLNKVLAAGIMQGYTDVAGKQTGEFGPDDKVTRGQLATILYRYANPLSTATTSVASYEDNTTPFKDCKSGQYYTAAINWAYRIGVLTGDASTKYTTVRPDDGVTREEAAAMLYRYAKQVSPVEESDAITFSAAPDALRVSTWARTAMSWCYSKGVMTGESTTGRLNPQSGATRAHIAKMSTMSLGA